MSPGSIEDKLAVNKYDYDREVHITLSEDVCQMCKEHQCATVCPAGCYAYTDGHLTFSYEGCLECGSCRIACNSGAIKWNLPRGGFGVCFEYG